MPNDQLTLMNATTPFVVTPAIPVDRTPGSVAIGDVNGNEIADIATANLTFNNVSIRLTGKHTG